jgi:hypothetical protein
METHNKVKDPLKLIAEAKATRLEGRRLYALNDKILTLITNHILASVTLFDVALILPLLVIPASNSVKITFGVISGSWIQLWALPALQRSQNRIQTLNDVKAKADHETLTYLATMQDKQMEKLQRIEENLVKIEK